MKVTKDVFLIPKTKYPKRKFHFCYKENGNPSIKNNIEIIIIPRETKGEN